MFHRNAVAAVSAAALTLLAGCGGTQATSTLPTPQVSDVLASPQPGVPSMDEILQTPPPPGPESDGAFMYELQRHHGIGPEQSRIMIPLARTTCDALANGSSREWIIRSGTEQGMDAATSRLITDAAIKFYCPSRAEGMQP